MNRSMTVVFSIIALVAASDTALAASVTTALLTVEAVPGSSLRVSSGTTNSAAASVCLELDLEPILKAGPAAVTRAVLRVQGTAVGGVQNTQVVRVFAARPDCSGAKDTTSLASWTIRTSGEEARASSAALRDAVGDAIKMAAPRLRLYLQSESRATNCEYRSQNLSRPRLIVTYDIDDSTTVASAQTTPWIFVSSGPPAVDARRIFQGLTPESDDPLVYRDDVVVMTGGALQRLSTSGAVRRSLAVNGTSLGKWSAIDRQGRLYNIGAGSTLRVFDLEGDRELLPAVAFPAGTALESGLTIAPGGNIYFATTGTSAAVYGLTPVTSGAPPQELWRSATTGAGATRVAISPPGPDFMAYTLANEGFFAIDAATGARTPVARWDLGVTKQWGRTDPVVAQGPAHDYVVLAAGGDGKGVVRAWSQTRPGAWYWEQPLNLSQPAIAAAPAPCDSSVVAIAGGQFVRLNLCNGAPRCASLEKNLAATSNILLDGQSNAYFWNNGKYYIYTSSCTLVLEQSISALAERLTLQFAADGTVITKSGSELFALQRRVPDETLTLQGTLAQRTIYLGNAIRVAPNATLGSASRVVFKARESVALGAGFRVAAGGQLSVQIQ